jgi:hypothetical protein
MGKRREKVAGKRQLKVIPIVHSQEETKVPYTARQVAQVEQAWNILKPTILNSFQNWKGVQVYLDSYAVPKGYTKEEYPSLWLKRFPKSPLSDTIRILLENGALLEPTEDGYLLVREYLPALTKAIRTKDTTELDKLDDERERIIVKNIDDSLRDEGLLLIGRKHLKGIIEKLSRINTIRLILP